MRRTSFPYDVARTGRAPTLHIPVKGSAPYAGCWLFTVRIWMEGVEQYPQWHDHVGHEVPMDTVKPPAEDGPSAWTAPQHSGERQERPGT